MRIAIKLFAIFIIYIAGMFALIFFSSCGMTLYYEELSESEEKEIDDLFIQRKEKQRLTYEEQRAFKKHLHSIPAMDLVLRKALAEKDDTLFCWIAETKDFYEVFRKTVENDNKMLTLACTKNSMNWFVSDFGESFFWHQPFDDLGNRLIHLHASHKDCDALKILLPFPTNVNAENNRGFTPIHFAFLYGSLDNIEILLKYNANINKKTYSGKTCLHCAAMRKDGDVRFIRFLLDKGSDINAQDAEGNTPLHYAFAHDNAEIVKVLIENGADIQIKNERNKLYSDKDVSKLMLNSFY